MEKGEIRILISNFSNDNFVVDYLDNGIWIDPKNKSSFGLELIQSFTEQLDGEMNRDINETGTHYVFKLKNIE
jgi:two-component sensor histidine kinase